MRSSFTEEACKHASLSQLKDLCEEIRAEIFRTVSVCGGHLASNLGVVELTVALHRVFSFPADKLVFDVGHQCYPHKLLTGRADGFSTLRKFGGISGFPKRAESKADCFDTGHAGTAISAALGIAKARDLKGENHSVIALVGDGSFNNGLVYEALNSISILKTNVLIILNDNGMSISPTVGGAHEILGALKEGKADAPRDISFLESFGLHYMGVYNGNDLDELLPALEEAKERLKTGCVLLHVTTKKGNGYAFSENAPEATHGISPQKGTGTEYSRVLGEELCALAERDGRIAAVTAAMTDSLGLRAFFDRFPERAYDVGICEEHASVLCAALATQGIKPYYAVYSTFLQRSFDEIVHDVCGQDLPVTFCIDRAGVTGEDGETHQGVFDLSYLSFIPNLTVAIPKNLGEFRAMLRLSASFRHPFAIRYPRMGASEGDILPKTPLEIGKYEVLHSNTSDIAIIAAGERCLSIAERCVRRAEAAGIGITLVNARFLRPLDERLLRSLPQKYILSAEDNVLFGGLSSALDRFYAGSGKQLLHFGFEEAFIPHGTVEELFRAFGPSEEKLMAAIEECHARG